MHNIETEIIHLVFLRLSTQLPSTTNNRRQQLSTISLLVVRLENKQLQRLVHADSVTRISSSQLHIPTINSEKRLNLFISEKIARLVPQITQVLQLTQIWNKHTNLPHQGRKINISHENSIASPHDQKAAGACYSAISQIRQ
nr:MAG TPA: hypothetical protein [Caudoviricetes sp.]